MRVPVAATLLCSAVLVVSGCGGSGARSAAKQPTTPPTTTASSSDGQAALQHSVRNALAGNYQLAVYVLWHNWVPRWAARSTAGPALAALRSAASGRKSRGVRVRMLSHQRRIVRVSLDPSYTRASAVIIDRQKVQPSTADGRPRGHSVLLRERARYELHRDGKGTHFLVWKVVLLH